MTTKKLEQLDYKQKKIHIYLFIYLYKYELDGMFRRNLTIFCPFKEYFFFWSNQLWKSKWNPPQSKFVFKKKRKPVKLGAVAGDGGWRVSRWQSCRVDGGRIAGCKLLRVVWIWPPIWKFTSFFFFLHTQFHVFNLTPS